MNKDKLKSLIENEIHIPTKIKKGKIPKMSRPTKASEVIPDIDPKYAHISID